MKPLVRLSHFRSNPRRLLLSPTTIPIIRTPSQPQRRHLSTLKAMSAKTRKDHEAEVRAWGFSHVFTWSDGPNAHYSPHTHAGLTTHLILKGQLTITYPDDPQPTKTTHTVGERIDVDANRRHEVWIGKEGCTYVIGE